MRLPTPIFPGAWVPSIPFVPMMPPPRSLASYFMERANGDIRPASPPSARTPDAEQPPPPPAPAEDEEPQEAAADGEDPEDSSDSDPDSEDAADDEEEDEEYPIPPAYTTVYTSDSEQGKGPVMLERVLSRLHVYVPPLYFITKTVQPPHATLYKARVHLRDYSRNGSTRYTFASHESATHATYRLAVSDAARRALWALTHRHRGCLSKTCFKVIPQRPRGGEGATVSMANIGEPGEHHMDTSAHVIAWLDTDLEDTTNELLEFQDRYYAAQARVTELEARLAGMEPPRGRRAP